MSVIAAVRKGSQIVIGADTQDNFGDLRVPPANHEAQKLREVNGAVLGASGWALYDDLLGHYAPQMRNVRFTDKVAVFDFFVRFWRVLRKDYPFVNDQPEKKNDSPFADLDATFLIASPGGIFLVSSNMSVSEFQQYYAIGSGGDFAIGALHALYDEIDDPVVLVERAVKAAIAYDSGCGGRVITRTVTVKGAERRGRKG